MKRMKAQMQKLNQEAEEDKSPDISALEEDRDRVSTFLSITRDMVIGRSFSLFQSISGIFCLLHYHHQFLVTDCA